ncbi:MAG: translation initiation factor eIF-2B [Candidatus Binatia bacterium]
MNHHPAPGFATEIAHPLLPRRVFIYDRSLMRAIPSLSTVLSDNTSGAQAITRTVTRLLLRLCARQRGSTPVELKAAVLKLAGRVLQAHPAMVSLVHLFNRLLISLDREAKQITAELKKFERGLDRHNQEIASAAARLIKNDGVVMTHSASQTVKDALFRRWAGGKRFRVVCTESRPAREGALLARALARRGIPTVLITDALEFSMIEGGLERNGKPDLILVGADAISAQGVINKAGTLGLALAARAWSVPFYVLAGSEKFAPRGYPLGQVIRDKPASEILTVLPKRLRVINRYFDITPLEYVTAIVSEHGVLRPERMRKTLSGIRIHPKLMRIIESL